MLNRYHKAPPCRRDSKALPCESCCRSASSAIIRIAVVLFLASPALAEDAPRNDSTVHSQNPPAATTDPVSDWLQDTLKPASQTPTLVRRPSSTAATGRSPGSVRAIDLLWPLALVLLAITVTAWLFRRYLPRGHSFGNGAGINLLARHYLSNRQSLCLVRIGRRIVFVGVTPEQITTLTEIPEGVESAEILSSIQRAKPGSFASSLSRLMSGEGEKEAPTDGAGLVPSKLTGSQGLVRQLMGKVRKLSSRQSSAEPA